MIITVLNLPAPASSSSETSHASHHRTKVAASVEIEAQTRQLAHPDNVDQLWPDHVFGSLQFGILQGFLFSFLLFYTASFSLPRNHQILPLQPSVYLGIISPSAALGLTGNRHILPQLPSIYLGTMSSASFSLPRNHVFGILYLVSMSYLRSFQLT